MIIKDKTYMSWTDDSTIPLAHQDIVSIF